MNVEARKHLEKLVGMDRVLLISTDDEYLGLVNWKRALPSIMSGRAEPVLQRLTPRIIKTPRSEYTLPLAVRVDRRIRKRVVNPDDLVSKRMILTRDDWTCKYCGKWGDTIDHIWPKSRGGPNTWENLCVACHNCNETKADIPLEELGWDYPELDLDFVPDSRGNVKELEPVLEKVLGH